MATSFQCWLDTFLEEKQIDLEAHGFDFKISGVWQYMPATVVYEHMLIASLSEQKQIKGMLIRIDFMNRDVLGYFRHLGERLAGSAVLDNHRIQ